VIIDELRFNKDVDGSVRGLIGGTITAFAWRDKGKP
jgi:hypothetical protein